MENKQYETSKFEEALKDLDRWTLTSKEYAEGMLSSIYVQDKFTNLSFIIKRGLFSVLTMSVNYRLIKKLYVSLKGQSIPKMKIQGFKKC